MHVSISLLDIDASIYIMKYRIIGFKVYVIVILHKLGFFPQHYIFYI